MLNRLYMAGALGVMLASCSSPVHVDQASDANLNDYKTYMWVDTRKSENDESVRATAYADISMRNFVNDELRALGWKEVEENPDALVSYDVLVEREIVQESDPVYSRPFTRYYYNPYTRRWGTIYYPSQFVGYDTYSVPITEGTITISVIDAKTDKRIWQGWTTEEIHNSRYTSAEIGKSVRNIFRRFDEALAAR